MNMLRFVFLALLATTFLPAAPAIYTIDAAHSTVGFSVRHLMISNVKGSFSKFSGKVVYDPANVRASAVEATIDVDSINTNNAKRDADLRGADFFEAAKYPTMTFRSTKVEKAGEKLRVSGDLTMHGVTKPVIFDVEVTPEVKDARGGLRMGAMATTKISRKEFGLTWNQVIEGGGVTVGDEVTLLLELELIRVKQP